MLRRNRLNAFAAQIAAFALAAAAFACPPGEGLDTTEAHADAPCACVCHAPARLDAPALSEGAKDLPSATLAPAARDAFRSSNHCSRLLEPPKSLS